MLVIPEKETSRPIPVGLHAVAIFEAALGAVIAAGCVYNVYVSVTGLVTSGISTALFFGAPLIVGGLMFVLMLCSVGVMMLWAGINLWRRKSWALDWSVTLNGIAAALSVLIFFVTLTSRHFSLTEIILVGSCVAAGLFSIVVIYLSMSEEVQSVFSSHKPPEQR